MANIIIPSRRLQQPRGSVGQISKYINPEVLFNFNIDKPANLGMAPKNFTWNWNNSNIVTSRTSKGIITNTAGASYGIARSFDYVAGTNSPFWFLVNFTGALYVNNGSGANTIFFYHASGSATGICLEITSTASYIRCGDTTLNGPLLEAEKPYTVVGGRDASGNCWFWLDGVLINSGTGATNSLGAAANTLLFGNYGAPERRYYGTISMFALGKDNPTTFGSKLSANPWQLFTINKNTIYFDIPVPQSDPITPWADSGGSVQMGS